MNVSSILWSRLDRAGHEAARLIETDTSQELSGAAVFVEQGEPVRLDYRVVCDATWRTQSASVSGAVGRNAISIEIAARDGAWELNGREVAAVSGCIDVDLNFSPSTNLLPIRRLDLQIGENALVRAAWLRFPSFTLEVLEQTYTRLAADRYQYVSGSFRAEITTNERGMATSYAGVWKTVASA